MSDFKETLSLYAMDQQLIEKAKKRALKQCGTERML